MRDDCGAIEEPIRAQKALRDLAGLGTEMFPVEAFVGMPRLTGTGVNRLKHLAHSARNLNTRISATNSSKKCINTHPRS